MRALVFRQIDRQTDKVTSRVGSPDKNGQSWNRSNSPYPPLPSPKSWKI